MEGEGNGGYVGRVKLVLCEKEMSVRNMSVRNMPVKASLIKVITFREFTKPCRNYTPQ